MNKITNILIVGLLLAVVTNASADANLITNGNFATGDLTGWATNNYNFIGVDSSFESIVPPADANFFTDSGTHGTMYQSFSTTVGKTYLLSFATDNDTDNTGGSFTAQINDTILPVTPSVTDTTWDVNTCEFTADSATSTLYLQFNFDSAGGNGFLTDISVTPAPEPGTLALVATGLTGFLVAGRRHCFRANAASNAA